MRLAVCTLAALASTLVGPPHLRVVSSTPSPVMGAAAFTLEVEHHTRLDQTSITGRAETLKGGSRITRSLTLTRLDSSHYSVPRTWEPNVPWVLLFTVAQGPDGSHGVMEAVVSIDRTGAVKGIEYTTPGFLDRSGTPRRVTRKTMDEALRKLLAQPS
jgi:hypothetical protein